MNDNTMENSSENEIYLTHIRAQISSNQINTDKCNHILLNQHFINNLRNSNILQPLDCHLQEYNGYISATWVIKMSYQL